MGIRHVHYIGLKFQGLPQIAVLNHPSLGTCFVDFIPADVRTSTAQVQVNAVVYYTVIVPGVPRVQVNVSDDG